MTYKPLIDRAGPVYAVSGGVLSPIYTDDADATHKDDCCCAIPFLPCDTICDCVEPDTVTVTIPRCDGSGLTDTHTLTRDPVSQGLWYLGPYPGTIDMRISCDPISLGTGGSINVMGGCCWAFLATDIPYCEGLCSPYFTMPLAPHCYGCGCDPSSTASSSP